jgi:uncharacterized OB-fold protein
MTTKTPTLFEQVCRIAGLPKGLTEPRFEMVYCSQCGEAFGPGNAGFSRCDEHTERPVIETDGEELK